MKTPWEKVVFVKNGPEDAGTGGSVSFKRTGPKNPAYGVAGFDICVTRTDRGMGHSTHVFLPIEKMKEIVQWIVEVG